MIAAIIIEIPKRNLLCNSFGNFNKTREADEKISSVVTITKKLFLIQVFESNLAINNRARQIKGIDFNNFSFFMLTDLCGLTLICS
jgi:hypothetical protein